MTESFSLWSYLLWIVGAGLELAIIRAWFQRKSLPHLTMLPVFVGFVLFSDLSCYAIHSSGVFGPFGYAYAYWWSQFAESILRSFFAVQILSHVVVWRVYRITVPRFRLLWAFTIGPFELQWTKATLWGLYGGFWIVALVYLGLPTSVTQVFIRVITVADLIGGLLVGAAILIPSLHWPKGYTTAAFGLFFSLVSDVGLFLLRYHGGPEQTEALRSALPLAFTVALLMLMLAVMAGQQPHDARKENESGDSQDDSGPLKRHVTAIRNGVSVPNGLRLAR